MMGFDLGQALREEREKAGMSQKELANKIGVYWRTVDHWEKHRRTPKPQRLIKIAKVLNIDIAKLQKPYNYEKFGII